MSYFQTNEIDLQSLDEKEVSQKYNNGFVFTRKSKGNMIQTRSLRVVLELFELSSENRRVLNKNTDLKTRLAELPLENYSWQIHALAKDFYTKKFGENTMSASKIKEMFNEPTKSNMSNVFVYNLASADGDNTTVGYALSYINSELVHYAYPFYDLSIPRDKSIGMAMMLNAIVLSKSLDKKYTYLGSVVEKESLYKLQFSGLEWWDIENSSWSKDLEKLKEIVNK